MTELTLLIAPDKFKGSVSAADAAASIAEGVRQARRDIRCICVPMADGGDGTLEALLARGWAAEPVQATDASGVLRTRRIAHRGDHVVVELAEICGIADLAGHHRPWHASSRGVGDALRLSVERGARDLTVALGGSASTDGGAGLLMGLGFAVLDAAGDPVPDGLEGLQSAASIVAPADGGHLAGLQWTVLTDVDAPLHGPAGAAHVFGPQKGLSPDDLAAADDLLRSWDALLEVTFHRPVSGARGAGAAGGTAAALIAAFDAKVVPGAAYLADATGLGDAIRSADAVVTGEGRFDASSLVGKAPGHVLNLAATADVTGFVIAGSVDPATVPAGVDCSYSLTELAGDPAAAQAAPRRYLVEAGRRLGERLGRALTALVPPR